MNPMTKRVATSVCLVIGIGIGSEALALNGAQLVAFSAATEGMAGAGASAGGIDSSTMITNAAALTEVPRDFRIGMLLGFPKTTFTSTLNPGVGAQASNDDPILLPSGSVVFPLMEDRLVWGMGVFAIAGFGNDYPASVIAGSTFASHSQYGFLKIVDSVAYKVNDQISVGLALHIDQETLQSNGATAALTQTTGIDRQDTAYGAGGSFGVLYKPFEFLRMGASYTTEQFFDNFERYIDILPRGVNYPQQANLGVTVTPRDDLLVAADFRWINWSGATGGFGDSLAAGGLGWRDQYIGMGGVQYRPLEPLLLRVGYNYGRSAVPASALFTNSLSTAIGKHHVGGGVGLRLVENIDLDLSYLRGLESTVTNTGAVGAGSSATVSGNQGNLDLTVRF